MSKFIHALVIERVTYDDTNRDEAGQPTASAPTPTDVMGLVQPRISGGTTAAEAGDYRSAGSEIADHTIFLPAGTDIRGADAILQGTRRYNVTGIRRYEYGGLAHIELDALLVVATPVVGDGS